MGAGTVYDALEEILIPQSFVVDRAAVLADREEKVRTVGSPAPLPEERRNDVSSWRRELFGLAPGVALQNFMGRERARTVQSGRQADPAGGHGKPQELDKIRQNHLHVGQNPRLTCSLQCVHSLVSGL